MARPRYSISAIDLDAAQGWIARHLGELPTKATQALKKASSPACLQDIVDRFFSTAQRRRLHTAIRQARHRAQHASVSVTIDGETADQLYQLTAWMKEESAVRVLKHLIFNRWHEELWERVRLWERKMGKKLSYEEAKTLSLALKAGQKLDK